MTLEERSVAFYSRSVIGIIQSEPRAGEPNRGECGPVPEAEGPSGNRATRMAPADPPPGGVRVPGSAEK
ncbi:hypothetical protein GCM10009661_60070 [Catellatospora chokoriensis]